ncbi:MAG: type II toxin-antitoxin system HipA family toxin [Bryobacteraceae bacterium]
MTVDARAVSALGVNLHGRRVGVINRLAGDKQLFAFEHDYVEDSDRPTLSLSYKSQSGGLVSGVRRVGRRVPPFFSNLLPEGHLRTYLADHAGVNPEREFFLLAALGADMAGAVTVTPIDRRGFEVREETGGEDNADARNRGALRFSLAGVQLKFSAVMETSGGLTIPAHGIGGKWIVKLPSMRFTAVSENELAMLELARAIGIDVPRIQLVPAGAIGGLPAGVESVGGNALATERFDREGGGERIHMEDFAQVFGIFPEGKYKGVSYANIARVLWAETGEAGTYEFVKRLVFSVLIGNADMHLKNWSLLYPDTRTPVLSPAYDFVATLPYIANDKLALTFGGSRSLDEITLDQMRRFTDSAGLAMTPVLRIVRETVDATVAAWQGLDAKDLLPRDMVRVIGNQIESVAGRTLR